MGNTLFDRWRKQHDKFKKAQPAKKKEKDEEQINKRIKVLNSEGALIKVIKK